VEGQLGACKEMDCDCCPRNKVAGHQAVEINHRRAARSLDHRRFNLDQLPSVSFLIVDRGSLFGIASPFPFLSEREKGRLCRSLVTHTTRPHTTLPLPANPTHSGCRHTIDPQQRRQTTRASSKQSHARPINHLHQPQPPRSTRPLGLSEKETPANKSRPEHHERHDGCERDFLHVAVWRAADGESRGYWREYDDSEHAGGTGRE
jgi:hypothetical protein